jgi:hypothetical protein
MVSPVGAGLNDSGPVGRRTVRRAVSLAVTGSVMLIAGLAAWLLGAVGGVLPQSAAGTIRLAGLSLVVAGALCGLAMIVTLVPADRAARSADVLPAAGQPEGDAGLAAAAPAQAASAAPEPLPGRAPLAGRLPPQPDTEPAPQLPPQPAPPWSPEPAAAPPPAAPPWTLEQPPDRLPQPAPEWAHGPAPDWAREPVAEWRPAGKPNAGWNPDSEEDWLRVLRGLRGSEQSPADQHISHED